MRRLAPGERADITDGAGTVAECVVTAVRPGELELAVLDRRTEPPPQPQVAVLQAIPKGDRGELAVELLTEVGTDVVVPWAADRCVAVWRGDRAAKSRARWSSAAEQAAKQSRRAWFPEVTTQADLAGAVRRVQAAALAMVLDPDGSESVAAVGLPEAGEIVLSSARRAASRPPSVTLCSEPEPSRPGSGRPCCAPPQRGSVAAGILLSHTRRWAGSLGRVGGLLSQDRRTPLSQGCG